MKKDLERTAQNAWNNATKFINKYGEVSGLAELYWQYNLTAYEFEQILNNLVKKGVIEIRTVKSAMEEVNA